VCVCVSTLAEDLVGSSQLRLCSQLCACVCQLLMKSESVKSIPIGMDIEHLNPYFTFRSVRACAIPVICVFKLRLESQLCL
jgi:hypothetical protein